MHFETHRLRAGKKSTPSLNAALAAAQGEYESVVKIHQGHGFKYANISDVLDMVRPILSRHGIAVMQPFTDREMVTILAHASGEEREFRCPMVMDATSRMNASQKVGAGVTYFRRYHLCSILGIATEDEMDAKLRDSKAPTKDFTPQGEPGLSTAPRGAVVREDMTPKEKAEACGEAIMRAFLEPKTGKGVEGVWKRNEGFIARFEESYPDVYANVLDAFTSALKAHDEEQAA